MGKIERYMADEVQRGEFIQDVDPEQLEIQIPTPDLETATRLLEEIKARVREGKEDEKSHDWFPGMAPELKATLLKLSQQDLENRQLKERLAQAQELSDRDPYNPEIYSYTGWYRIMRDKVAELRRNGKGAVLLAIDLDRFGDYNDSKSSHTEGDLALGIAGEIMKKTLRPSDIVARLHGDEYVALVETDEIDGGVIAANRVRESMLDLPSILNTDIELAACVGVVRLPQKIIHTEYSSDTEFKNALDAAYTLADRAQYNGAKLVGKNKVGVLLDYGHDQHVLTAVVTTFPDNSHSVGYEVPAAHPK